MIDPQELRANKRASLALSSKEDTCVTHLLNSTEVLRKHEDQTVPVLVSNPLRTSMKSLSLAEAKRKKEIKGMMKSASGKNTPTLSRVKKGLETKIKKTSDTVPEISQASFDQKLFGLQQEAIQRDKLTQSTIASNLAQSNSRARSKSSAPALNSSGNKGEHLVSR